jgi:uroporphyrinogen III methyltransferase/synthase
MFMLNPKDDAELNQLLDGVRIASIGPVTGKAIANNGVAVDVQPQNSYTIENLVEQIITYYTPK